MNNICLKLMQNNTLLPIMGDIFKIKLPYDVAFRLYKIGRAMDEANDYFVKEVNKIRESNSDTVSNDLDILGNTEVELNVEPIDKDLLFNTLASVAPEIAGADLLMLTAITTDRICESSEPSFSIKK